MIRSQKPEKQDRRLLNIPLLNIPLGKFLLIISSAVLLLTVSCGLVDEDTEPLASSRIPSVNQLGETPHFEIYWSTVENAAGYRLKRITPDGHQFMIDAGDVTHYQDTGMVPQVLYDESTTWVVKYDVCALDEEGNEGPWAGESEAMMYQLSCFSVNWTISCNS